MQQADFYLLDQTEKEQGYRWACHYVYGAWKEGKSIYIHCENAIEAKTVDDMLWTFKDTSFIPHQLITDHGEAGHVRVVVGYAHATETVPAAQILLNLAQTEPEYFNQFHHIVEVVPQAADERVHSRKKYKLYKQAQYNCITHKSA